MLTCEITINLPVGWVRDWVDGYIPVPAMYRIIKLYRYLRPGGMTIVFRTYSRLIGLKSALCPDTIAVMTHIENPIGFKRNVVYVCAFKA